MATYMYGALRRASILTRFLSNSHVSQNIWMCKQCRNIHRATYVAAKGDVSEDRGFGIVEREQSWIRKMLYGSGPSTDVEELEEKEEESVQVEARYMDILQEKPSFLESVEIRKQVYRPPSDLVDVLRSITVDVCKVSAASDWEKVPLSDNIVKYKVLTRCSQALKHDVPNFHLNQMKTMSDVLSFYQVEVKDTSKFDELSAQELPPNLQIHWDYKDDSKLELYEDWLEYIKPKMPITPEDIPKIRHW
ncbi:large ribosomal subunit protein mL50-like [Amphiura filiformis]|uniref:large ribosomal subunit protein mL50-like n=1 Tax=Amphiura filiformis TaxID=82378 RepID=UPI003B220584